MREFILLQKRAYRLGQTEEERSWSLDGSGHSADIGIQ